MAPNPAAIALLAALDGNLRLLKKMSKKMDLRETKDPKGLNALHFAANKGSLEICKFLVEEVGVDVNSVSSVGATPMFYAALKGNLQVIRYLLDHGSDPAKPSERGLTPLHNAAEHGHCEIVKLLLSKGVDVDVINYRGTPLHMTAAKGQHQAMKILLEHGADHRDIPIKRAAVRGQRELVELLFPKTNPIPSVPDWSVDGIITTMKSPQTRVQDRASAEERKADLKSQGKEAFAKKDYFTAMYYYGLVMEIDPLDATLFANRSLCWLRMREGDRALADAQRCKMLRPGWSKAWYREGSALSFMEDYQGAVDAFQEALRLDPESSEIKKMLSEAKSKATR